MFKSDSLSKLAPALVKAQKAMGAALKDSRNPFYKSRYADLNAIIDAAIPALNENGIAVLQSPGLDTISGCSVINTILLHESGEFLAGQSKVVAAKVNDPQAEGSATTYARRYGLQAMVTLKAEDDDAEASMGRGKTEVKPVQTLHTTAAAASNKTEMTTITNTEVSLSKEVKKPQGKWESKKTVETTKNSGDLF